MGKKYKNPPIVEAFCEFRFDPKSTWDLTIPGLIYEQLKAEFPIRQPRKVIGVKISSKELDEITHTIQPQDIIQLRSESAPVLIQVGEHLLTINHLAPYSSWSAFSPHIKKSFETYREVANPVGLTRIGLRYINRIELEQDEYDFRPFEFRPQLPSAITNPVQGFILGIELEYEKKCDVLRIQLTSTNASTDNQKAYLLDLDYFLQQSTSIDIDRALEWVEKAHSNLEEAFEKCITNELRQQLGEDK